MANIITVGLFLTLKVVSIHFRKLGKVKKANRKKDRECLGLFTLPFPLCFCQTPMSAWFLTIPLGLQLPLLEPPESQGPVCPTVLCQRRAGLALQGLKALSVPSDPTVKRMRG